MRLANIARCAGVTSQAIYRHFRNRDDLYYAAVAHDIERLQNNVLTDIRFDALPHMTGRFWESYQQHAGDHPLARLAVSSRDPVVLNYLVGLPSSQRIFASGARDLAASQRAGLIRADVNLDSFAHTVQSISMRMMVPFIFDGAYEGADWQEAERLLLAALFYPVPDLSDDASRREIERRMAEAAKEIARERGQDEIRVPLPPTGGEAV
ncbi:AcrR family transcriptional regulator [Microbacterium sp. AK009]|nr:AcrR family transcriptional regulator [Microbacterium sp. AK009]